MVVPDLVLVGFIWLVEVCINCAIGVSSQWCLHTRNNLLNPINVLVVVSYWLVVG